MKKPKLGSGERFKQLKSKLKTKGVKDPEALAASIGRKKYGNKKFNSTAKMGRDKQVKNNDYDEMSEHPAKMAMKKVTLGK